MPSTISFRDCVFATVAEPEFLKEYDRLRGTSFAGTASPIERMVDEATGRFKEDCSHLIGFIFTHVWMPFKTKQKDIGVSNLSAEDFSDWLKELQDSKEE